MDSKKLIQVVAVDVVLAGLIIVTYGVFGLSFGDDNTVKQALAITLAPTYFITFLWFNYKNLLKPKWKVSDIKDKESLSFIIHKYYQGGKGCFDRQILLTEGHISRFEREKESLKQMLYENFREDDQFLSMTNLVENGEESFTTNVQQIIKRLSIFDFKEYALFCRTSKDMGLSPENYKKKDSQFKEHIAYVSNLCNKNEELLLELNNLITEVSRINDSNRKNNLLDIQDTVNAMKQLHFSSNDAIDNLAQKYK